MRGPAGQARGFTLKSGSSLLVWKKLGVWRYPGPGGPPSGPGPRSHSPWLTLCGHTEPSGRGVELNFKLPRTCSRDQRREDLGRGSGQKSDLSSEGHREKAGQ